MKSDKDLLWFKSIVSSLQGYEVECKFFEEGDFGSLNQIEFNSESKGGNVDFWSSGWIGIYLVDYIKGDELINLLLEPTEKERIEECLEKLVSIIIEKPGRPLMR